MKSLLTISLLLLTTGCSGPIFEAGSVFSHPAPGTPIETKSSFPRDTREQCAQSCKEISLLDEDSEYEFTFSEKKFEGEMNCSCFTKGFPKK